MRLKKLILPLLGLFILSALSYAAGARPQLTFKASREAVEIWCNFTKQTPESEHPSLTTGKPFKVGQYAGRTLSAWELLENALKKEDNVATELIKYCVRGNNKGNIGNRINENFLNLVYVSSYYGGDNADDIIKYIMDNFKWDINIPDHFYYEGKKEKRTALACAADIDNAKTAELLVKLKENPANPFVVVSDNGQNITVIEFAKRKGPEVYKVLLTVEQTSAMIQNAVYKTINYAMTNKDEFSRLMEKIKSNGIVADFLRVLDGNTLMRTNYNLI
jgi:hypothetical protein